MREIRGLPDLLSIHRLALVMRLCEHFLAMLIRPRIKGISCRCASIVLLGFDPLVDWNNRSASGFVPLLVSLFAEGYLRGKQKWMAGSSSLFVTLLEQCLR